MNSNKSNTKHRLLVISRLLPVSVTLVNDEDNDIRWEIDNRRSHGAMFSGINALNGQEDISQILYFGLTGDIKVKDERYGTTTVTSHMTDVDTTAGEVNTESEYYTSNIAFSSPNQKNILEWNKFTSELKSSLADTLYNEKSIIPIFVDPLTNKQHYEGYCKTELWPLFHYILWDSTSQTYEENNWNGYIKVNQMFADAVEKYYKPGDMIWIQDYHLLLLPEMIRKKIPTASIGLFMHTTFPTSEIFRCLPKRKEVLKGILGSNLVGFQIYSYSRHFISTCTRVLGLESTPTGVEYEGGNNVSVETFNIGIDVEKIEKRRLTSVVKEKMESISSMYEGKRIIIGTDKLDKIKGVKHKLIAFEKFLKLYPEWQNKVILIQVTSSANSNDSKKIESQVSEMVAHINGMFGTLEFTPVHYYHHDLDQDEYFALLNIADVGLITSVRDGMNTTSHEFVLCQKENHGPLILSEFTGTAGSFSGAILVNPWDHEGVANAINEALVMSKEERDIRYEQLYKTVSSNTSAFWAKSFYKELKNKIESENTFQSIPPLDEAFVMDTYKNAQKRVLLFDYDGTLTPICNTPSAAIPSKEMLSYLTELTKDPKNFVFIISGRDQQFLDQYLNIDGVGLSAEHGSFIKYPNQSWRNATEDMDLSWKDDVINIFNFYTERTQGSFVENKRCAVAWHYRLADPDYGAFQSKECQNHLESVISSKYPVEIVVGKKCLEVRPSTINKGEIVNNLLIDQDDYDFVFCVGDDKTDEDMFKSLNKIKKDDARHIFTCRIGKPKGYKCHASSSLQTPFDLIKLLGKFSKV